MALQNITPDLELQAKMLCLEIASKYAIDEDQCMEYYNRFASIFSFVTKVNKA